MEPTEMVKFVVEYGFAGFAAIEFVIIVWMMKKLLEVLKENSAVIEANTLMSQRCIEQGTAILLLETKIHETLLQKPCIAKG